MNLRQRRDMVAWLKQSGWGEIQDELIKSRHDIECEECGSNKDVYFLQWDKTGLFACIDCVKNLKVNDFVEPQFKGSLRTRFMVLERDGFRCVYCGRGPSDGTVLEVDHVHPRSKGGSDQLHNLVTACRECNQGKGDLLLKNHQLNKPRG